MHRSWERVPRPWTNIGNSTVSSGRNSETREF